MADRPLASPERSSSAWRHAPIDELVASIAAVDHPRLRAQLVRLGELLAVVARDDGDAWPETLVPLRSAYACLRDAVTEHLDQADQEFFPALRACDQGADTHARPAAADCRTVERVMRALAARHSVLHAALGRLREVTRGYAPPENARPAFRELYYGLADLERDLDARLRRERDLLFPRAVALGKGSPVANV